MLCARHGPRDTMATWCGTLHVGLTPVCDGPSTAAILRLPGRRRAASAVAGAGSSSLLSPEMCPTPASCIPLQALMNTGITAGTGDTSWPHLRNQANPWQAQVLSAAENQTVDGALSSAAVSASCSCGRAPASPSRHRQQDLQLVHITPPPLTFRILHAHHIRRQRRCRGMRQFTKHTFCAAATVSGGQIRCIRPAGFYIIPRSPTEVYYDVSTEAVEAQLYNWFYCCNTTSNSACPKSAPTCPAARQKPYRCPCTRATLHQLLRSASQPIR
jgi:hypothetical protein